MFHEFTIQLRCQQGTIHINIVVWIRGKQWNIFLFEFCNVFQGLTRVGHILKKSHEGHLGVFFDPQKEIVITSEPLGIFQPKFTGVSKMAANMAAEIPNRMYLSSPFEYRNK